MESKIKYTLVALFVAIIFITSYMASANFGAGTSSSTTTSNIPRTVYAAGSANAVLSNYTDILNVSAVCKDANNSAIIGNMTNKLNILEANGSVNTFFPETYNISIESGSMATSNLYDLLYSTLNQTAVSCTTFKTGGVVTLPTTVKLYFAGGDQPVSLQLGGSARNYVVPITISSNMSTNIKVDVAALLTANGTVYGNLSVTKA